MESRAPRSTAKWQNGGKWRQVEASGGKVATYGGKVAAIAQLRLVEAREAIAQGRQMKAAGSRERPQAEGWREAAGGDAPARGRLRRTRTTRARP